MAGACEYIQRAHSTSPFPNMRHSRNFMNVQAPPTPRFVSPSPTPSDFLPNHRLPFTVASPAQSPVAPSPPHECVETLALVASVNELEFTVPSNPSSRVSIRAPSALAPLVNDTYNFEDWNVAFEVEDTIYRVHKFFFKRESSVFAKMFEYQPEGQPIPLSGISCAEFDALLEFMYSAIFDAEPMSPEKWVAILHLSNIWSMAKVKDQALKHVNAMQGLVPVDKIVIAAKNDVDAWFLPAYCSLVERNEPISVEEARKLFALGDRQVGPIMGMDLVPLLAQARERFRTSRPKWQAVTVEGVVREVFGYLEPGTPPTRPISFRSLSRLP